MTIDRWSSRQAYERFRSARAAEYRRIDGECEKLTEREDKIGEFDIATLLDP